MATIGQNIKKLRESRGWSQSQLGEKIGKTRTAIWQYEHDKTVPRMGAIEDLASVFGVSKSEIVETQINYASISFHDLSHDEIQLVEMYRSATKDGKRAIIAAAEGLAKAYPKSDTLRGFETA